MTNASKDRGERWPEPHVHPFTGELRLRPERLVGMTFRRGVAALDRRDATQWQFAWQDFADAAGPQDATALLGGLTSWVGTLRRCAGRRLETFPAGCPGFCRDECLAISLIAASQQGACPALKACAFALLGSDLIDEPLTASAKFGDDLAKAGQRLSADAVCNVLAAMPAHAMRPS
ncbi:MAG: hypothetical protein ACT4N2_12490 [Hyphomicrobium sp.]